MIRGWYSDSNWHYWRLHFDLSLWSFGGRAQFDFGYKELDLELYVGPFRAYLSFGDFR